jgi:hypothetical protein
MRRIRRRPRIVRGRRRMIGRGDPDQHVGMGTAHVLLDATTMLRLVVDYPHALDFLRVARWGRRGAEGRMFLALVRSNLLRPGYHGVRELAIARSGVRLKPERDT